jgi:hypothetical protein
MDDVNDVMKRGLVMMRDRLAALLQSLDPQFDVNPIMQHNPIFPLKLNWNHCRDNFLIAAEETAHSRYIQWYHAELEKAVLSPSDINSDSTYMASQGLDDDFNDDGPCCNTRARKKQRTDPGVSA